jgi:biopolymer transport protein ExbB
MMWEISAREYLLMGGPIMGPLVLVSLLLAYLIAERYFFLVALTKNDLSADEVISHLGQNTTKITGAGLYRRFLQKILHAKKTYGKLDLGILEEANKGFIPELTKNFTVISCLITAAPLLGLLGTVCGMIKIFKVMNIYGTSNPHAMSGGISEALIITQFGLVVAIIGMYVQLFVEKRAKRCILLIEDLTRHIKKKFEL